MSTQIYIVRGEILNRLTALEDAKKPRDMIIWLCVCGQKAEIRASAVKYGRTKSCGCLQQERINRLVERNTVHGLRNHPLYGIWRSILGRCENPNREYFKDYGGRGIKVCARWHDARNFIEDIEKEIGPRPPGVRNGRPIWTLDRINNDGDYEPGNMRWATPQQQTQNRRKKPEFIHLAGGNCPCGHP